MAVKMKSAGTARWAFTLFHFSFQFHSVTQLTSIAMAMGSISQLVIGRDTKLWANVSIYHNCVVGERCLFQSGAVIGSDGFGYANDAGRWIKIPQVGRVVIGNDVEIGASTTIDRGAIDDTVIEDNVIIDNQVQIAHNDKIGFGTAIAGATVVAGSVTIGKYCIIGGTSVFNGHISICDGVHILGQVGSNIKKPGKYQSFLPVQEASTWFRRICLPTSSVMSQPLGKFLSYHISKSSSTK